MTFLAPGFLLAAAAVAALTVGLHFLVTQQPPSAPLPTARFVPNSSTTVVTPARRPRDLLLLLLRVLLIAAVGVAFARPRIVGHRQSLVRLVVGDRSSAVGDMGEVRDSVRRLLRAGDVLVAFDSTATVVRSRAAADSGSWARSLVRSPARGVLSTALIAAIREAGRWRDRADSLELDVISPLRSDEIDSATPVIRNLWRGRIHVVRVGSARDSDSSPMIAIRGSVADPLREAAPLRMRGGAREPGTPDREPAVLNGVADSGGLVRLVRDSPTSADSMWAGGAQGRVLVIWPAAGALSSWAARSPVDAVGAVIAFRPAPVAVVARFERPWRLDAIGGGGARVVARWVDGDVAAVQRPLGAGCVRDVAIPVNPIGDLVLRPAFGRLAATLLGPCGRSAAGAVPLTDAEISTLAGAGGAPLLAARRVATAATEADALTPWVVGLALTLAGAELLIRGQRLPRTGRTTERG